MAKRTTTSFSINNNLSSIEDNITSRKCIIVLGMHRSGTSMVTRCLNLAGAMLPKKIIKADENNQAGYWEPMVLNSLNERILKDFDSGWDDWRSFDTRDKDAHQIGLFQKQIAAIIAQEYGASNLFVIKEPRISRLVNLYHDTFIKMGVEPHYVIMTRNPKAAIASTMKRDKMSSSVVSLIWLRNELDSEFYTRGQKRVFLKYETLLQKPVEQILGIQKPLSINWPETEVALKRNINKFVDPAFQNHFASDEDLANDDSIPNILKDVYQILIEVRQGQISESNTFILDSIRSQLNESRGVIGQILYDEFSDYKSRKNESDNEIKSKDEKNSELSNLLDEKTKINSDLVAKVKSEQNLAKQKNKIARENLDAAKSNDYEIQIELGVQKTKKAHLLSKLNYLQTSSTDKITELQQELRLANNRVEGLENDIILFRNSRSWQITWPLRAIIQFIRSPLSIIISSKRLLSKMIRGVWFRLPFHKTLGPLIKRILFSLFPFMFFKTSVYQNWKRQGEEVSRINRLANEVLIEPANDSMQARESEINLSDSSAYTGPIISEKPARLICFYLPQFHAIPQNDEWWGNDFTEWTNVKPAKPQFEGHYQPRIPAELGYYNLLDEKTMHKQTELAKNYGIEGFCFYFYWFGGERLLEKPVENYLNDKSLDLPFCLCWANENWSRRWDGLDSEILIAQDHSPEDDIAFIKTVANYMKDPRYIRIGGKPVLLVYRPSLLPDPSATSKRWRKWCLENDIGEIHLVYPQSFETANPADYGFDAASEFPPNNSAPPNITGSAKPLNDTFEATVYDWSVFPERSKSYVSPDYTIYRSVCPSWDNTARRKEKGTVFLNSNPSAYQKWLENAIIDTNKRFDYPDEKLIFVNAWNEWAEGAYLEPDKKYGHSYLNATRKALLSQSSSAAPAILLVTHDCHPHGAQYLALAVAKTLRTLNYQVHILALGGGPLADDFKLNSTSFFIGQADAQQTIDYINTLSKIGIRYAIANTIVSGSIVPTLKKYQFKVLSLVHEMQSVIKQFGLEKSASNIAKEADKIIFPAEAIARAFKASTTLNNKKVVIRPQGLLKENPYKGKREEAFSIIRKRHNLKSDTKIILNIAYADERKAPDYFVRIAAKVIEKNKNAIFIWIGDGVELTLKKAVQLSQELMIEDKVIFLPFTKDIMSYYAAASVLALSSREDPFPNVIIDAIEVSTPVVAFKEATGAASYIIENGGRCAPKGNIESFAKCVIELMNLDTNSVEAPNNTIRSYVLDILYHLTGMPRVSVVLPNYNYAALIEERIKNIQDQDFPLYELIILDDKSIDKSVDVIEAAIEKYKSVDIRVIINEKNSGSVFKQWNKGLELAKGDYIWIAEADDLNHNNFVSSLIPAFKDPKTVLSFSQSIQMSGSGAVLAETYLNYTNSISDIWNHDYVRDGNIEIAKSLHIKNTIPNVSAVIFEKSTLKNVFNEFDNQIYEYTIAGDWFVYLHVLKQGKISFKCTPLNMHRRHDDSVTKRENKDMHLREIHDVQQTARAITHINEEALKEADDYLDYVAQYLGVKRPQINVSQSNRGSP